MRLGTTDGCYVRPADPGDVRFVRNAARDWPTGDQGWRNWESMVYDSDTYFVPLRELAAGIRGVPNTVLIYCLADDTPAGFVHFSVLVGGGSGIDIHHLAIAPAYRGQGHFSRLAQIMARLALALGVDGVHYEALESAPQVATWARNRSGAVGEDREADSGGGHRKRPVAFDRATIGRMDLSAVTVSDTP